MKRCNKYILLVLCFLYCVINIWGQNNDIFVGDGADGYDSDHFIQVTNNSIFVGGIADGYGSEYFIQLTNNDIFVGDGADGYDSGYFIQLTNNDIFVGDGADGYNSGYFIQLTNNDIFVGDGADSYDSEYFIQLTNNSIFSGGIADGYHLEGFIQMTNSNRIFGGGVEDGYDLMSFLQSTNNRIFGGGVADGYDMQISLLAVIETFSYFNPFTVSTVRRVEDLKLNAFPTPFTNYLNINLPEPIEYEEQSFSNKLFLLNSKGTIVRTYEFQGDNIRVEASKLPTGLYTLFVKTKEKVFKSQVVKIRSSISE